MPTAMNELRHICMQHLHHGYDPPTTTPPIYHDFALKRLPFIHTQLLLFISFIRTKLIHNYQPTLWRSSVTDYFLSASVILTLHFDRLHLRIEQQQIKDQNSQSPNGPLEPYMVLPEDQLADLLRLCVRVRECARASQLTAKEK